MKNLVLLVEGQGDVTAVPALVKRVLTEQGAWAHLRLDENPIQVGEVKKLTGSARNREVWTNRVKAAGLRKNTGGILLVLDGDADRVGNEAFCHVEAAYRLAERAAAVGAGHVFSLACVFALQEFESWLLAGLESLAGKPLPDGRPGVIAVPPAKPPAPETSPRDAKGWLNGVMTDGYRATTDQAALARMVSLDVIRATRNKSLARLERAVNELIAAFRDNKPIVSPHRPSARP